MKEQALKDADSSLSLLKSYRPLDPMTVQRLREEMMLESTYESNAIEGSRLTLSETVIVVKDAVTVGSGHPIRDVMAARGVAAGFEAIFDFRECPEFCVNVLFSPHYIEEHAHGAPTQTPRSHLCPH